MASREGDISEECADICGISEPLLDELDHKMLPCFLEKDGVCMEKWQNMTNFEREEYAREIFLKEFPAQREEIVWCIRHLLEMADAIDETYKKCTIASIAANSTSASSGILNILGMTLAPFTAGKSLIMLVAGLGLGRVAAAAGVSANIYESVRTSAEKEKAQELMNKCEKSLRMATCPDEADFHSELPPNNEAVERNITNFVPQVAGTIYKTYDAMKNISTYVKALKSIKAKSGLRGLANQATEAGRTFWGKIWGAKQVEKAGSTLAMSKGARLLGAATSGAFVLFDAYNIVQGVKHLTEGAKAETTTEIRNKAMKLEAELQELTKLYENIWSSHYLKHPGSSLGMETVSSCGSQSYPLPTRPQRPTQRAPTKPTRASCVGQHPMQQTIMGSPQGFQNVDSSGSLQPAHQRQRLTAAASTKSQQNLQDKQAERTVFQGGPCTRTGRREGGNTGARKSSECTLGRGRKEQVRRTRRPSYIKHSDEELSREAGCRTLGDLTHTCQVLDLKVREIFQHPSGTHRM